LVIDADDPYGNMDTSFNNSVTVGLASGSAGSLTETAVSGVATFPNLVDDASGSVTLTATSGDLTNTPSSNDTFTISPAAPDHFVVTTSFANPDVAGSVGTVTVAAYDAYGNPVNSGLNQYEGTADLSSTDSHAAGLPASYSFTAADDGTHTFSNIVLK
jgi:large repetitive protein